MLILLLASTVLAHNTAGDEMLAAGHIGPRDLSFAPLARRETNPWGGYFLLVKDRACPSATFECGKGGCCPNGTFCWNAPSAGGYPVCCPNDVDDCSPIVSRVPACAERSWTLWISDAIDVHPHLFCCAADEVGTSGNDGELCIGTKSVPVPTSIILGSVTQVTKTIGAAAITGAPGGISTASDYPGSTHSSSPGDTGGGSPNSPNGSGGGGNGGINSSPSNDNGSSNSGLSNAATIAISVLATAVGLMLAFLAWFIWYRKRKNMQEKQLALLAPGPVQQYHNLGGPFNTIAVAPPQPVGSPEPQPPAYVPPHPQTQELHAQGTPSLLVIQQYGQPAEPELDGVQRQGRNGTRGQENCTL